ncbi:MAG TPA: hypothetical protein VHF26_10170, partial [Trebonia sp.]|nr:hypothetical protein [Trebonia sp.]
AARCCEAVLAAVAPNTARWWQALRAQVKSRLAVAVLRHGDAGRCHALLAEALDAAAGWREHPALAAVLDACAYCVLHGTVRHGTVRHGTVRHGVVRHGAAAGEAGTDDAERAATLLGAAHAVRGAFDESSLDAPPARAAAVQALGSARFAAAYEAGRTHTYESAVALARAALSAG